MPIRHSFVPTSVAGSTDMDINTSDWNTDHVGSIANSTSAIPEVLTRVFDVTSSNTSAVSTFLNFSVPARTLGTNRMLRWTMRANAIVGSTAAVNSFNIEYQYAGSSRWKDLYTSQAAASAVPQCLFHQICIAALNSSGTRIFSGMSWLSSRAVATTGIGDFGTAGAAALMNINSIGSSVTFTITTGATETFIGQFNWSGANSSLSFRMFYGILELI